MAFHPERLTGRRARRYAASLSWTDKPVSIPDTLKSKVRKPEYIRGFARVQTDDKTYHYVVLIRHRIVFVSHPMTIRQTAVLIELTKPAQAGEGLRCKGCYRVLDAWKSVKDRNAFVALPPALADLVRHRTPSLSEEIVAWNDSDVKVEESVGNYLRRSDAEVERRHPARWREPTWLHQRLLTPRHQNGIDSPSLSQQLSRLMAKTLQVLGVYRPHTRLVIENAYQRRRGDTVWAADDPYVKLGRDTDRQIVKISVHMNLFNWYVRVYHMNRVVLGDYLIISAAKGPHPEAPVLADALHIHQLIKYTEFVENPQFLQSKSLRSGTPGDDMDAPIYPGIIAMEDGKWEFFPMDTINYSRRVGEGDQFLIENLSVGYYGLSDF